MSYEGNSLGQVTQRDTEGVTNAPHARYYYFGGQQMGDVSNDGTSNVDYVTSIKQHTATPGSGFFVNGKTTGTHYADFDQSYDAVNGLTYQSAQSNFVVKAGDTLQSIAQEVWGDANFWYLIAEANGLDSTSASCDRIVEVYKGVWRYNAVTELECFVVRLRDGKEVTFATGSYAESRDEVIARLNALLNLPPSTRGDAEDR